MHRFIIFAALLGGVGLGAWSSFTTSLKAPGLDFTAIARLIEQNLPQRQSAQVDEVVAHSDEQPHAGDGQALFMNAALDADALPAPSPQMNDFPVPRDLQPSSDQCGAWSVSDVGMEEILKEMIRRGWTPPQRSKALPTFVQGEDRPALAAVDPEAPASAIASSDETATGQSDTPHAAEF